MAGSSSGIHSSITLCSIGEHSGSSSGSCVNCESGGICERVGICESSGMSSCECSDGTLLSSAFTVDASGVWLVCMSGDVCGGCEAVDSGGVV